MLSPRLKFKVLLTCAFGFASERTRLTKFLSASNQIVKDLDCPPLPPEGRKNDQPASKLARSAASSLNFKKERIRPLQPERTTKISFLKELTGGCYHRRAERLGIENPSFAATVCYRLACHLAFEGKATTLHCLSTALLPVHSITSSGRLQHRYQI
jgi:hypothetical protein